MNFIHKTFVAGLVLLFQIERSSVEAHAKLIEPPMRSSMWRFGYNTPINYNDNELFCGGIQRFLDNGGKCGTCGDPYDDPNPEHEAGGRFATGTIVRYYPGRVGRIPVTIDVTAHHKGFFEFRLCAHNDVNTRVSQACLDRTPLVIEEGEQLGHPYRYFPSDNGLWNATVRIPPEITCRQCVLQMRYKAGNSWGVNHDNASRQGLGYGPQEEFRNCADISIGYPEPPSTTMAPTSGKPNSTRQNKRQNNRRVRGNATGYQSGSHTTTKGVGNGSKSSGSQSQKEELSTKRYQKVYNSEMAKLSKLMRSDRNGYNFRVQRIEESLSLLDDTERVLEALESHLYNNSSSIKMSGSEFVKLYAGLAWVKRKIRHLESLATKVSSKLSLIRHSINQMTKSRLEKGMRLSEHAVTPGVTRRKIGASGVLTHPSGVTKQTVGTLRRSNESEKYEKRIVAIRNEDKERPVYRMAARRHEIEAKQSGQNRKRKVIMANKRVSKVNNAVKKTDNAKSTQLVAKFPALDSWNKTDSGQAKQSNYVSSRGKPPVMAPDSMPWSPNTLPMMHDTAKRQDTTKKYHTTLKHYTTIQPIKHDTPKKYDTAIVHDNTKAKHVRPKSGVANVMRPVLKSAVRTTKPQRITKTKANQNIAMNSRKLVQIKNKLSTKDSRKSITNEGASVLETSKERKRMNLANTKRKQNKISSPGEQGQQNMTTKIKQRNINTTDKLINSVKAPKQDNLAKATSAALSKLSNDNPLRPLLAEIKESKGPGSNNGMKTLLAKLRVLSKMGGPMSNWVLAELKNRIINQHFLALQARQQRNVTLPVASNHVK